MSEAKKILKLEDDEFKILLRRYLLDSQPFWADILLRMDMEANDKLPFMAALEFHFSDLSYKLLWNPILMKQAFQGEYEKEIKKIKDNKKNIQKEDFQKASRIGLEKTGNIFVHELLHWVLEHTERHFSIKSSKYKLEIDDNGIPQIPNVLDAETKEEFAKQLKDFINMQMEDHISNIAADLVCNQLIGEQALPRNTVMRNRRGKIVKDKKGKPLTCDVMTLDKFGYPANLSYEEYYARLLAEKGKGSDESFINLIVSGLPGTGGHFNPNTKGDKSEKNKDGEDFPEGTFGNFTEEAQNLAKEMLKEMVKEAHDKFPGDIPGNVANIIKRLLKTAQIPWQQELKQFYASSVRNKRRPIRTMRNRRWGIYFPGSKRDPALNLAIFTDTSGSVSDELHVEFYSEFNEIISNLDNGCTLVQCDTSVQSVEEEVTEINPAMIKRRGYGGTSLEPPFNYFAKEKRFFDAVIYTTDGYVPVPSIKVVEKIVNPANVLFVIKGGAGYGYSAAWNKISYGRVIKLR